MHTHAHSHPHSHSPTHNMTHTFGIAIVLLLVFAGCEFLAGLWGHSLALQSDAGHMASDALALFMALAAMWIANRPPSKTHSYGFGRAEVLTAWISSLIMLLLAIFLIVKAIFRFQQPEAVHGNIVIITASIGIVLNLCIAWRLMRLESTLNLKAALLHILGDLLGSFAALIAGLVIIWTRWTPIDPLLSFLISGLIIVSSIRLLRESLQILMEGVPPHIELPLVQKMMLQVPHILNVHDLHIWTLSSGSIALSAHVHIPNFQEWPPVLLKLQTELNTQFGITHITLQPEPDVISCMPCAPSQGTCPHDHNTQSD